MKHIKKMKIDIDKKNFEVIPSVQYDSNTRFLHINLLNGAVPFNLTGCSVKISGTKPDGTAIFNNCTVINAKEGFIEVALTEQMNAAPGILKCELKLYNGKGVLTTKHFDIDVTASVTSKAITSSNEFKALEEALSKVNNIDTKFESLTEAAVKEATAVEIQKQIECGAMANLAIGDGTITKEKLDPNIKFGVEDGGVTSEKIANEAVKLKHVDFLETTGVNPFDNLNTLVGEKITHGSTYATEKNSLYVISSGIELINATTDINLYAYDRIAFFGADGQYISALGRYNSDADKTNATVRIGDYPILANATSIKVCIKKEHLSSMYIRQGNESLMPNNAVTFEALKFTQNQINEVFKNVPNNSIPFSALKEVKTEGISGIEMEDGYKIAGNGDDGYASGKFSLVAKNDATTTVLIPVNANDDSTWEFENVARISFFGAGGAYIDSLYDSWNNNPSAHPPTSPIKIFERFPSLRNTKKVRLSIKLNNKADWSLKIDGVEYFKPAYGAKYHIKDLIIKNDNLSESIKAKLAKVDDINKDNSFKNHKDTTIVFKKNKDFASTHFRIPFMCVTNLGTIIAGCDIRYKSANDHSLIDIGTARSEDGGKTWIDKTVAIPNPGVSSTLSRVMDGTILATKEGRVFLIGNKFNTGSTGWANVTTPNDPNWDCVMYKSDDDGRTWQFHQSLKSLLPEGQISFLGGVGSGIQMKDGTLIFPIQMSRANDKPFKCQSGIIYSNDNGATWKMSTTLIPEYTSECSIVEYPTGTIMINCRQEGQNHRSIFKTVDLGTTWEETLMNAGTQQTNACQGHMCKVKVEFNKEVILFSNPINDGTNREDGAKSGYDRSNLSLSVLQNDSKFTPIYTLYRPHSDGYSCTTFDERRNRLYVVMELEYNLVFRDITDLLPTIQLYKNLEV